MAKIIAICGKICCGKTYYANQIKEKEKAIILSCDELTKGKLLGCKPTVYILQSVNWWFIIE